MKDLATLPKGYASLISQHIDRLAENPRPHDAKKLKGTADYGLRVGIYRILYDAPYGVHRKRIGAAKMAEYAVAIPPYEIWQLLNGECENRCRIIDVIGWRAGRSKDRHLNEDSVIPAWIAGIQATWM